MKEVTILKQTNNVEQSKLNIKQIVVYVVSADIFTSHPPIPRIMDYCNALKHADNKYYSVIMCYRPWMLGQTLPREGDFKGIHYWYACNQIKQPKYKPAKAFRRLCASLNALCYLLKYRRRISLVHLHFREDYLRNTWFWFTCKCLRLKLSRELAEIPFGVRNIITLKEKMNYHLFNIFAYKYFDAFITITTYLENWISIRAKNNATICRIPISINLSTFKIQSIQEVKKIRRLCYIGVLKYADELDILIKMFKCVKDRIDDVELIIVGDFKGTEQVKLQKQHQFRDKLRIYGMEKRVIMLGEVEHEKIPEIIGFSDILVLPRPYSIISKAGFPSKLAEYLALEKPVVVTATGDIPLYLDDGVSAYLVYSDSPDEFAAKVLQVIKNPDEARRVAKKGRKVAEDSFSLPVIGELLCKYINDLNKL